MKQILIVEFILLAMVLHSCKNKESKYGDVTLPATTKILNAEVLQSKLVSIDSTGYTFTFRTGNKIIDHLETGDVLVAEMGAGLIRKVTGISKKNGEITVSTTQAGLTDAIKKGELKINQTLTAAMVQSVRSKTPGITIRAIDTKPGAPSGEIEFEIKIVKTDGNQETIVLTGLFSITPSFIVNAEIQGSTLVKYRADYSVIIKLIKSVDSVVDSIAKSFSGEAEITFSSETVLIGPVPVIIQPRLTVEIGVEPGQRVSESDTLNQPIAHSSSVEYDPVNSWGSGGEGSAGTRANSNSAVKAGTTVRPSGKGGMDLLINGEWYPPLTARDEKKPTADWPQKPLSTQDSLPEKEDDLGKSTPLVNTAPTALFTINPPSGTTATEFQFDASGCTDAETPVSRLQVRWDWESNGTWTPFTNTKTASHVFFKAGSYTVLLEVKDGDGLTSTTSKTITVTAVANITANDKVAATPVVPDGIFTDPRDGNTYPYKNIGTQTWMIKNLAWLPAVSPSKDYSVTSPYYYVIGYEGSSVSAAKATPNYTTYGVLYNWEAAKTACPPGWHLPTDEEWKTLEKYLGMSEADANLVDDTRLSGAVGGKLKESGNTHWKSPNEGANNSSGFTALPGGNRNFGGDFSYLGSYAYFWSSSESDASLAWYRYLYYGDDGVYRNYSYRYYGFSARCLQN